MEIYFSPSHSSARILWLPLAPWRGIKQIPQALLLKITLRFAGSNRRCKFIVVGLQRKRLLENLKSEDVFFPQTDLVCLYRQVENRPGRLPDRKKRLDMTDKETPVCYLRWQSSFCSSPATDILWDPKCGAALLNLVAPVLRKKQVKFYKPSPLRHDFSPFNPRRNCQG